MRLPFTPEAFFQVFERYHQAIWPAPIIAYILAAGILVLLFVRKPYASRIIYATLALYWLMGSVYYLFFFRSINKGAIAFGVLFIVQAGLFILHARKGNPGFHAGYRLRHISGWLFITYAIVIYPLLGASMGHSYPAAPMFGVAPCPTVIFTFGIFLMAVQRMPYMLMIIPFLWSIVGISAAMNLGVTQDWGLPIAGIAGLLLMAAHNAQCRFQEKQKRKRKSR